MNDCNIADIIADPFNRYKNASQSLIAKKRMNALGWTATSRIFIYYVVDRVVGLFNNDGVTKPPNATATLNLSTTSVVGVVPRVALKQGCWEWDPLVGDRQICGPSSAGKPVKTVLAPGASRFLRFV